MSGFGGEGEDCGGSWPSGPALAAVLGEPLLVVHRGGNRRLWCTFSLRLKYTEELNEIVCYNIDAGLLSATGHFILCAR